LVRRLCPECAESYEPTEAEIRAIGLDPDVVLRGSGPDGPRFRRPRGCRACEGTGYLGRVALYEMMGMDAAIRDMTFRGAAHGDVRRTALASGALRPLLADGARKVTEGVTSVTEVLRVVGSSVASSEEEAALSA
ncbi:MAG: type II/IV secretion system protein, partial [Planctomycetota bacterium]